MGRRIKKDPEQVTRYADMFAAMGTESRLRIMPLLLSAHPDGMVVGEIQEVISNTGELQFAKWHAAH